jgi:hypothetical protein
VGAESVVHFEKHAVPIGLDLTDTASDGSEVLGKAGKGGKFGYV